MSSGKTGLFYCHAEVQMYIADAYGNQVIREVDSCSYQHISFQLLVHLHSLHSSKGACAHTLSFFAASTTLKVDSRGHSRHSARRKSFSSWLWFFSFTSVCSLAWLHYHGRGTSCDVDCQLCARVCSVSASLCPPVAW